MNLISLTLARNSAWCIEAVLRHALNYCDAAVVLCHSCTDGTQDIVRSIDRTHVIEVDEAEGWSEMKHRQQTLDTARELGATHFLILDDDEVAAQPLVERMRPLAESLNPGVVAAMPMVCCWRDLDHYRSDKLHNPFRNLHKSTVFADHPLLCWDDGTEYQHHHTAPRRSAAMPVRPRDGAMWMHLQHASWPRLVTKQTWYQMHELCRYGRVVADYAGSMSERGLERTPVPVAWWNEWKSLIDLDARPWQADDINRMVAKHGINFFTDNGINVKQALDYWA